jgi:hypothetical protein
MKITSIEEFVKSIKAGTIHSLIWERPAKTKKSCEDNITKTVQASNLMLGASYDNLKRTKEGRKDGTLPVENAGLNGFEWVHYPLILKSTKSGKLYLRVETMANSKFHTEWRRNKAIVAKTLIEQDLLSSEKRDNETMPIVMNIALDSITAIN